jgi:hypothetical protein
MSDPTAGYDLFGEPKPDPQFEKFWKPYPLKVDRKRAQASFARALRRASFDTIYAGLLGYPFSRDPAFIPHPTTWLNNDRWKWQDYMPPPGFKTSPEKSGARPISKTEWMEKYERAHGDD